MRFVELVVEKLMEEFPANEFGSGGGPAEFALEIRPSIPRY